MTHPSVLFVAQGKKCFIYHDNIKWRPTFLELATTLKYLGAKWLPKKKLISEVTILTVKKFLVELRFC